ncbi:MAG: methylated-DNA--[protein]-cysteine S-methyltransferase [Anaerolineae bacterium]
MTVAYAGIMDSPLGDIWLCATEEGLCYVAFEAPDVAAWPFGKRYGIQPVFARCHEWLEPARQQLKRYFAGDLRAFDLPLDMRGTVFQRSVWRLLRQIPYGATCTYGDLALQLGKPKAARAVGQAVGANPIAIVVPCHRVVGSDGALVGYGGGLARKQFLLELEQAAFQPPIPEPSGRGKDLDGC